MPPSIKLWKELVMQESPILSESAAELLYYRAATAWGHDQKFEIIDCTFGCGFTISVQTASCVVSMTVTEESCDFSTTVTEL
jgi:hypothetical protein